MAKKKLKVPKFKSEDSERDYWANFDSSVHFDSSDFVEVSFPDLKPTSRSISIRIPEYIIVRVKEQAHELNIPYQTLIKQFIAYGSLRRRRKKRKSKT